MCCKRESHIRIWSGWFTPNLLHVKKDSPTKIPKVVVFIAICILCDALPLSDEKLMYFFSFVIDQYYRCCIHQFHKHFIIHPQSLYARGIFKRKYEKFSLFKFRGKLSICKRSNIKEPQISYAIESQWVQCYPVHLYTMCLLLIHMNLHDLLWKPNCNRYIHNVMMPPW